MTDDQDAKAERQRSILAYVEHEAAHRRAGGHPRLLRFVDSSLAEIAASLRRDVEGASAGDTAPTAKRRATP